MVYSDPIYGQNKISEPVLVELINTKAMQRLRGIAQQGYLKPYFTHANYTRFDHSVGVMLLLRRYDASLTEQVAGLIHDVSHTVFSHAGDFVFGTQESQSFQDSNHERYIRSSDIPMILEKYKIEVADILDYSRYPLLETELPDLCADRIDYSLRELAVYHLVDSRWLERFFNSLKAKNNKWYFEDLEVAKDYADKFMKMNNDVWVNPKAVITSVKVSDYLKHALSQAYIKKGDLFDTDDGILKKLYPYHQTDKILKKLFEDLNTPWTYREDTQNPQISVTVKSRAIDPRVDGKRLSELLPEYKVMVEKYIKPQKFSLTLGL